MTYVSQTFSFIRKRVKRFVHLRRVAKGYQIPVSLRRNYYITSEIGIFHLSSAGYIRLLTNKPGYGLAIHNNQAYFSYDVTEWAKGQFRFLSKVISANVDDLIKNRMFGSRPLKTKKVLYCQPFTSNNGRIHQITFSCVEGGDSYCSIKPECNSKH